MTKAKIKDDEMRLIVQRFRISRFSLSWTFPAHRRIIFSQKSYMVYIHSPLLQSTVYRLYKLQPFPIKRHEKVFVYIETKKELSFVDAES